MAPAYTDCVSEHKEPFKVLSLAVTACPSNSISKLSNTPLMILSRISDIYLNRETTKI